MRISGVHVWVASPMEKIFTDTQPPHQTRTVVSLSAAKGEYESFQIVLRPQEGQELSIERLEFTDQTSILRPIPPENISARLVAYVKVSEPSHNEKVKGMFPDPLIPFKPCLIKDTRSFWITVKVPEDASAGKYDSSVKIIAEDNKVVAEVPIALQVWDFALPGNPPALVNAWGLYEKPFRRYYDANFGEMLAKYKQNLWAHRITHLAYPPTDIPVPKVTVLEDGKVSIDYSKFDKAVEENVKHGMNALDVPVPGRWSRKEREVKWDYPLEVVGKILGDFEKHLAEQGWLDMSYTFLIDEPGRNDFAEVKKVYGFLKSAAPGLKRRCDFEYGASGRAAPGKKLVAHYRDLAGYVDIWVPHIDGVDYEFLSQRQKLGEQVWWCLWCGAGHPYPQFLIDYPGIDCRVPFWTLWKYGVTGFAYWTVNWWPEHPFDVFKDAERFEGAGGANGDGLMIYPGKDGPIDSIRWELIRDGFEDYEYLALLSKLIAQAKEKGISAQVIKSAQEALAGLDSVVQSSIEYTKDAAVLSAARQRIGDAIESLERALGTD